MITPLIDSHAHLDFDRYDEDRDAVLERARAANVDTVISIGIDIESSERAHRLAQAHSMLFATAGIHPHQADAFDDARWDELEALWQQPKVRGVGETGLDYYYDYADQARQRVLFERHLQVAGRVGLPVVVHIRDAFDDAFDLIERNGLPSGGILHCFTGDQSHCRRALDLGMYISLSGIVTFKNAKALRAAVADIPLDRVLVETDSPFRAPVPHRGKRNEPAYVVDTTRVVAELMGQSVEAVARAARANTISVFGLPLDG